MDFIERLLNISPDGGNGTSEIVILTVIVVTFASVMMALQRHFPKSFTEFLEQLGKKDSSDRFDN